MENNQHCYGKKIMENNQSFINMIMLTDQNMSKLSKYELGRLTMYSGIEAEFKKIRRADPFLGNLQLVRVAILEADKSRKIIKNMELARAVGLACGDEYSYKHAVGSVMGVDRSNLDFRGRADYISQMGSGSNINYRVNTDKLIFGGITIERSNTLKSFVYEDEKMVGTYESEFGMSIMDGLLSIQVSEGKTDMLYKPHRKYTLYRLSARGSRFNIEYKESGLLNPVYTGKIPLGTLRVLVYW